MDVPVENLVATVNRYNELCKMGKDVDYGKRSEMLTTITEPPFYALKWGPALLNVHGELFYDTGMHVLDSDSKPIPGLFAVGNVAGGLCRSGLSAAVKWKQPLPRHYLGA